MSTFWLFKSEREVDEYGPKMLAAIKSVLRIKGNPQSASFSDFDPKRTLSQNDMHAGLCRSIAKALKERTGLDYDVEYMRTKTKRKFGVVAEQVDPDTGKPEPFLISTTKYSRAQFSKLIEGTLAWAAVDLGLSIDRPRWADEWRDAA